MNCPYIKFTVYFTDSEAEKEISEMVDKDSNIVLSHQSILTTTKREEQQINDKITEQTLA